MYVVHWITFLISAVFSVIGGWTTCGWVNRWFDRRRQITYECHRDGCGWIASTDKRNQETFSLMVRYHEQHHEFHL